MISITDIEIYSVIMISIIQYLILKRARYVKINKWISVRKQTTSVTKQRNMKSNKKIYIYLSKAELSEFEMKWRGERGWRSGEGARLSPSYVGWAFVVGSRPCSDGFSPGSPVFLPPQKPTFLNSNSIWDPRATGLSVATLFNVTFI